MAIIANALTANVAIIASADQTIHVPADANVAENKVYQVDSVILLCRVLFLVGKSYSLKTL